MVGIVTTPTSDRIAAMQEQAKAIANAFASEIDVKKRMAFDFGRLFVWIATSFLMFSLTACATGPKTVFHSFDYGSYGDNPDIEILNYQYGNSKLAGTRPPDWALEKGHIGQGGGVSGAFPVGDFLYVKWRIESTGKIYEDTVNLKIRLPSDMDQQRLHFLIKDTQLYVYLISKNIHTPEAPDCPVSTYHMYKCITLYPNR